MPEYAEPDLAQILRSLPEDLDEPAARDELAELLRALSGRPVPTGRLLRAWTLGSLNARVAAGYGVWYLRAMFAGTDRKERLRNEAHLRAGLRLVGGMGYLRGAIAKVGQTLACYPDVVPAQLVETLEALHFEAPPMHYALVREHVRDELGADPEQVFAEFDTRAFAAASLGQVHKARLKSGEPVAVKIQYPNIARTIRADFANLRLLAQPMRLSADWGWTMASLADIERTLVLETDYAREADMTERAREALAGLDDVVVPRVHRATSSERVLTLDLLPGAHARAFLARDPDQAERDRRAEQVLRAGFRLWCSRLISSDVNPGNFLFLPDGRLGLIDFGCVRELDDEEWRVMLLGVRGEFHGGADLDAALKATAMLSDEEARDERRMELLRRYCAWLWEPLKTHAPFDFGDEDYLRRGFGIIKQLMLGRYNRTMPVFTWMDRMMLGLRGLFHTLRARPRYGLINDQELARIGIEPPARSG